MADVIAQAIADMRDAGRDVPLVLEELLLLLAQQIDALDTSTNTAPPKKKS